MVGVIRTVSGAMTPRSVRLAAAEPGMNPAHNASLGNASYSRGDKLRLCAPAHSGLPLNAVAIVAASRPSPVFPKSRG